MSIEPTKLEVVACLMREGKAVAGVRLVSGKMPELNSIFTNETTAEKWKISGFGFGLHNVEKKKIIPITFAAFLHKHPLEEGSLLVGEKAEEKTPPSPVSHLNYRFIFPGIQPHHVLELLGEKNTFNKWLQKKMECAVKFISNRFYIDSIIIESADSTSSVLENASPDNSVNISGTFTDHISSAKEIASIRFILSKKPLDEKCVEIHFSFKEGSTKAKNPGYEILVYQDKMITGEIILQFAEEMKARKL